MDLHSRDFVGRTASFSAYRSMNEGAIRLLLECGVDVNEKAISGSTALSSALGRAMKRLSGSFSSTEQKLTQ